MTPEPSNEYQKLVEAVARAMLPKALHLVSDYRVLFPLAEAALSALKLPHAGDDQGVLIELPSIPADAAERLEAIMRAVRSYDPNAIIRGHTPPAKGTPHV